MPAVEALAASGMPWRIMFSNARPEVLPTKMASVRPPKSSVPGVALSAGSTSNSGHRTDAPSSVNEDDSPWGRRGRLSAPQD